MYMKSSGPDLDRRIKSTKASSSIDREFKPAIGWLHLQFMTSQCTLKQTISHLNLLYKVFVTSQLLIRFHEGKIKQEVFFCS